MPYIRKSRQANVSAIHADLVKEIKAELEKEPTLDKAVLERQQPFETPHVIEGTLRNSDRLELWVIWKKWAGIREEHRSAAIRDAYEQAFGDRAKRVIVAIGVTPDEAEELGVISK